MLVLNRKEGESLTIGDTVKVTLVKSSHGKARIGIDAPRHVPIVRDALPEVDEPSNPNTLFDSHAARLEWVRLERMARLLVGSLKLPDPVSDSRVLLSVPKQWLADAEAVLAAIDARMRGAA